MAKEPNNKVYTPAEVAFILCYTDYCKKNDISYKETISEAINKEYGRSVTFGGLGYKLTSSLKKFGKKKPSISKLIQDGTAYLAINNVDPLVVTEMNEQRRQWGLGPLGEIVVTSPRAAGPSATHSQNVTMSDEVHCERGQDDFHSVAEQTAVETHMPCQSAVGTVENEAFQSEDVIMPVADVANETSQPEETRNIQPHLPGPARHVRDALPLPVQNVPVQRTSLILKLRTTRGPSTPQLYLTPPRQLNAQLPVQTQIQSAQKRKSSTESTVEQYPNKKPRGSSFTPNATEVEQVDLQAITLEESVHKLDKQMSFVLGVCKWMIEESLDKGKKTPPETHGNVVKLFAHMKDKPEAAAAWQAKMLASEKESTKTFRDLVVSLIPVRDHTREFTFPAPPDLSSSRRIWRQAMEGIRKAVGLQDDVPEHLPTPLGAAFLTARAEDIASGRLNDEELMDSVKDIDGYLKSPYAVQTLMGALFCRLVFQSPEPMCEEQYSTIVKKQYENIATTESIVDVQRIDMQTMKQVFDDPDHQRSFAQHRASTLVHRLSRFIKQIYRSGPGFEVVNNLDFWAMAAIKLKQTLMISDREYRIHLCRPGTEFNPYWMDGITAEGRPVAEAMVGTKKVSLCLFPAIAQQDSRPIDEHATVTEALIGNRKFFPTFKEKTAFDWKPKDCITKATVLLM